MSSSSTRGNGGAGPGGCRPRPFRRDRQMSAARSRSWRWLLAALAATACGCSREASVSGKVTYKDKPVTYGTVIVLGPEHKASSGAIQPDGSYTVEGLVPGEAQFGVVSRDPAK